jgi:hypothetical protein
LEVIGLIVADDGDAEGCHAHCVGAEIIAG